MRRLDWFTRVMLILLVVGVWALVFTAWSSRARRQVMYAPRLSPSYEQFAPQYGRPKLSHVVVPPEGLRFETTEGKVLATLSSDALGGRLRLYDQQQETAWMAPTALDRVASAEKPAPVVPWAVEPPKPTLVEKVLQVDQIVVPAGGLRFVSPAGRTLVRIGSNEHGAVFGLFYKLGNAIMSVSASDDRAELWLQQTSGAPAVQMAVSENWGGMVTVRTGSGKQAATLSGARPGLWAGPHEYGGNLTIWHAEGGMPVAEMSANASGADLHFAPRQPGMTGGIVIGAGKNGGRLTVRGKGSQILFEVPRREESPRSGPARAAP